MKKLTISLPSPLPASNDCLPHAAMNLGGGHGIRPAALVTRLIVDEQYGNFVLYRLDDSGGFVGDTWHGTLEDALWQIKKEFGIDAAALLAPDDKQPPTTASPPSRQTHD